MARIVSSSPKFSTSPPVMEAISNAGWSFQSFGDFVSQCDTDPAQVASAQYLVAGLHRVDESLLSAMPKLKAILRFGVGYENIDVDACTRNGIAVLNTPRSNGNAVAELAIGLMFSMLRHIPQAHQDVVGGRWNRQVGNEVAGKTLGIVGLGHIGKLVAGKALALGMKVMATDKYPDHPFIERHGIQLGTLEEVMASSDVISLHVFGGEGNTALVNAERIAMMRQGACLINLARGDVIDLDAAAEALASGSIGGVAIDTYIVEPPDTEHPIFSSPGAVFTPHSGADTVQAIEKAGLMICEDIETIENGKVPERLVNQEVLERSDCRIQL
ncbi:MAG: hydroxyacid dehydrogenase [Halomonas sp.]|nr:hydroxyacid dehydrogenase [Halomonas sp.]